MIQKIRIIGAIIGSLLLGSFFTIMIQHLLFSQEKSNMQIVSREDNTIPVIFLNKIENGILHGSLNAGQVRIQVEGQNQIEIVQKESFQFSVLEILPNLQMIPAPEGMNFVASKRGKYFFALDDPKADLLSPANRVFFSSEEEAISKGYSRGK